MHDVLVAMKKTMEKTLEGVQTGLSKIRTGRAHPELLDHVKVEGYGSMMPLSQLASVNVEGARSLLVSPWDKSQVASCEKALRASDLGLNPSRNGDVIRVPLPSLTEERRRDMIKIVKEQAESGKVSLRNARRNAISDIKKCEKDNEITQDEAKKFEADITKITEEYVDKVTALCSAKESELLTV